MPDMRAVHLLRKYNPAQWGGTETAIQRLFEGLRTQGVESVVYCPRLEESKAKSKKQKAKIDSDPLAAVGCRIERYNAFVPIIGISQERKRQMISVGGNLLSFDLLSSLWREPDISVMHTHTLGRIGGIALTVARQRRIPFVVSIHGGVLDLPAQVKKDFNTSVGGWEWGKLFGLIFQSHKLFPAADAIVTVNANEARLLREKYPGKRIVVQTHGVPLDAYRFDHRAAAIAAFPQIAGRRVLLCVGRIDSIKNQAWLVDQAPEFLKKFPNAILVLAGAVTDEAYGKNLASLIESANLQGRILLTGGLPPNDPRLIGLFQQAEVLLVPSKSETFGLVILEAWATGTMVVSSRTSGASALIRHGENGWLFDLDAPQAFHESLAQALAKTDRVKDVLRRGSDEVRNEYSLGAVADRMKKLYEELIEEKNALRHPARRRHQCADAH